MGRQRTVAALLLTLLATLIFLTTNPPTASANCGATGDVTVGGGYDGFESSAQSGGECSSESGGSATSGVPGSYHTKPVCLGGAMTCDADGEKKCSDGTPMVYIWFVPDSGPPGAMTINCPDGDAEADPGPTLADVITAFRHIPLPHSKLQIQPPDGETLVNFETNFLTDADPFERSVTLLGHTVDFKIRPATFHWSYGDGATASTSKPGARYPTMGVTHVYQHLGSVKASVDTTWSADYRIDGGSWAAVPDTVTISGAAVGLRVRSATPLLAGADAR
jgi:hypothetical protein